MSLPMLDPVLAHTAAAALSAILLIGAVQKLSTLATFTETLAQYQLLPESALRPVAWLFPLAEAVAGTLLLVQESRSAGMAMAMLVLLLATAAVAINVRRGRTHFDCGCGTGSHTPVGWSLVARNAVLLGLLLVCGLPQLERATTWLDAFSVLSGTVFLLGTYLTVNTLLANAPRLAHLRKSL